MSERSWVWVRHDDVPSDPLNPPPDKEDKDELGIYRRAQCNTASLEDNEDENKLIEVTCANGSTRQLMSKDVFLCNEALAGQKGAGVDDMTSLTYMEEANLLFNLRERFNRQEIYTNIAKVLIAVNPYERLDVYNENIMKEYRGDGHRTATPHTFKVAEQCYLALSTYGTNQSLIVSGESGAGKTESAKQLMRYLARRSHHSGDADTSERKKSIEQQVLDTNPILEAFGNAKTVLNNNSSRFGKFTKIFLHGTPLVQLNAGSALERRRSQSEAQMCIDGSSTETYLLEKSRVVAPALNERNYHVFYQICSDANPDRESLLGKHSGAEAFSYLVPGSNVSGSVSSGSIKADGIDDAIDFKDLCTAMETVDIDRETRTSIFRVIATVMHLGNIKFCPDEGNEEKMRVDPECDDSITLIANLCETSVDSVIVRLTSQKLKVRRDTLIKFFNADAAVFNRDAFAKELYAALFDWVLKKINKALMNSDDNESSSSDHKCWVGILDVFGFECFTYNSLEQFCINFANERLQQHFNANVLLSEQEEYVKEAIFWTPLSVADNEDAIKLIDDKGTGIISLLNSACIMPQPSDEKFTSLLFDTHTSHLRLKRVTKQLIKNSDSSTQSKSAGSSMMSGSGGKRGNNSRQFERINGFSFQHYAGDVVYNVRDFLVKNTDRASPDTLLFLQECKNPVAHDLLPPLPDENAEAPVRGRGKKKVKTLGALFQQQLRSLMTTLEETSPHYVRCIKPNRIKRARYLDLFYVRPQMRCGGLVEAVRMLKHGFPTRATYSEIASKFSAFVPQNVEVNARDLCEAVFLSFGMERSAYQLGLTKAFFRSGKQAIVDRILLNSSTLDPAIQEKIQSMLRQKKILRSLAVVKCAVRFSSILKRSRAIFFFRRMVRVSVIVIKTFIRRSRNLHLKGAIAQIQAGFHMILLKRQHSEVSRSSRTIMRFWRHNRNRRILQLEILKRRDRKHEQHEVEIFRNQECDGLREDELESFHSRFNVLVALVTWFKSMIAKTDKSYAESIKTISFLSSLGNGVTLVRALRSLSMPVPIRKMHLNASPDSFFARSNFETFFHAAESLGVNEKFMVSTDVITNVQKHHESDVLRLLCEFANCAHQKAGALDPKVTADQVIVTSRHGAKKDVSSLVSSSTESSVSVIKPDTEDVEEKVISESIPSSSSVSPLPISNDELASEKMCENDVEKHVLEDEDDAADEEAMNDESRALLKSLHSRVVSASSTYNSSIEERYDDDEVDDADSEYSDHTLDDVDLSLVNPPEELQKEISALYSIALRNNRFNLIRMFSAFNEDDEKKMFSAFDLSAAKSHDEELSSLAPISSSPSTSGQYELSSEEQSAPLSSIQIVPLSSMKSGLVRVKNINAAKDALSNKILDSERNEMENHSPIVDIQVLISERGEKVQAPAGYHVLQSTYAGRSANLNKGSRGRGIYLCFKRLSADSTGFEWKRINGRLVLQAEEPITAMAVIHREFNEATPHGFERISRTERGQDANLNYGTAGLPIYLCVKRGDGAPINAINLFVAKKNDPFPPGFRWIIQTPDKHVANLNRGTNGRILFLLYRMDMHHVLHSFRRLGFARRNELLPIASDERALEIYYSRVFACTIAALHSTNEALVTKALDVIGAAVRDGSSIPISPLKVLMNVFCQLMSSFSSCFRKTQRLELESVVLLILRDVFIRYINELPIQTLTFIFVTTLHFRPDMARAALVRQMYTAAFNIESSATKKAVKKKKVDANLCASMCASIVKDIAAGVAFAISTDADVNAICTQDDSSEQNRTFVAHSLRRALRCRKDRLLLSIIVAISKQCSHDDDADHTTPIDASLIENLGIERRIHSMELLLYILEHSSEWIQENSSKPVIELLTKFLSSSLLRCCSEGIQHRLFFQRVLQIIVYLWRTLRQKMKNELLFIIDIIFLGILKSENCTSRQKQDILEALAVVFHTHQDLVDVFFNFDNDPQLGMNIFENLLMVTTKISDGVLPSSDEATDSRAEISLRRRALENMVTIFYLLLERVGENSVPPQINLARSINETDDSQSNKKPQSGRSSSVWVQRFTGAKLTKASMERALALGRMDNLLDGLSILVENAVSDNEIIDSIVAFLLEYNHLFDREDVGRFLCLTGSEYAPLPMLTDGHYAAMVSRYFDSLDFTDLDLVDALRDMFKGNLGFYIPYELDESLGFTVEIEAEILDQGRSRLLRQFARAFVRDNSLLFPSVYTCERVVDAIVTLNEDTHFNKKMINKSVWLFCLYPLFSSDEHSDKRHTFELWRLESYFDAVQFARLGDEHLQVGIARCNLSKGLARTVMSQNTSINSASPNLPAMMNDLKCEVFDLVRKVRGQLHRYRYTQDPLEQTNSWRIVSAMFEVSWPRFIASISTVIDNATRRDVIFLCLDGLMHGALLALRLGFPSEFKHFTNVIALMSYTFKFEADNISAVVSKTAEDLKDDTVRGRYLEQEWLKELQANSFDEVEKASARIIEIVEETKLSVKLKLNCDKLREVCSSWAPDFKLVKAGREFVGQGQLSKMNSSGKVQPYLFILFNDVLLYGDMTTCHQVIHMSVCQIMDVPDQEETSTSKPIKDKKTKFAFKVQSPRKEFLVLAANSAQKSLWMSTITRTMLTYRSEHRDEWQRRVDSPDSKLKRTDDQFTPDACELCIRPFSAIRRRRSKCPMCKHNVCQECLSVKISLPDNKKRKVKVCDCCVVNSEEMQEGKVSFGDQNGASSMDLASRSGSLTQSASSA